jgi:hypothetical protein
MSLVFVFYLKVLVRALVDFVEISFLLRFEKINLDFLFLELWNCFVIECGEQVKYLIADTVESMRTWLEKIQAILDKSNR